jgi:hypothetical protein
MATVVNESPVWEDPLSSGVAVLVQEESISFQANISDPEGQNLTFAWDMTCSDQETVTFFTHSQQNKAQLVFPTDSPTVCMITVEACDVCGSCLKDSTEVRVLTAVMSDMNYAPFLMPDLFPRLDSSGCHC